MSEMQPASVHSLGEKKKAFIVEAYFSVSFLGRQGQLGGELSLVHLVQQLDPILFVSKSETRPTR